MPCRCMSPTCGRSSSQAVATARRGADREPRPGHRVQLAQGSSTWSASSASPPRCGRRSPPGGWRRPAGGALDPWRARPWPDPSPSTRCSPKTQRSPLGGAGPAARGSRCLPASTAHRKEGRAGGHRQGPRPTGRPTVHAHRNGRRRQDAALNESRRLRGRCDAGHGRDRPPPYPESQGTGRRSRSVVGAIRRSSLRSGG
jgi:hypothetical protein